MSQPPCTQLPWGASRAGLAFVLLLFASMSGCLTGPFGDSSSGDGSAESPTGSSDMDQNESGSGRSGENTSTEEPAGAPANAWNGTDRLTLAQWNSTAPAGISAGIEGAAACTGGPRIERTSHLLLPGSSRLDVTVTLNGTSSGIQVGYTPNSTGADYSREESNLSWLPTVTGGEEKQTVDVPAAQTENSTQTWAFYYRYDSGQDNLCSTGLHQGSARILVEAVKG